MQKKPGKGKLRRIIRLFLWVLLIQVILINISAAFYARKLTCLREGPPPEAGPSSNIFKKTWKIFVGPGVYKTPVYRVPAFPYDAVKLTTANHLLLDAWYGKTDSVPKGTVILFHGITSNKGVVLDEANEFRFMGFNVLLVDFRAHGNSEGKVTTAGVRESEDVKLAYDFVTAKGEKNIFLWGQSMGAVVICKTVSDYGLKPSGMIMEMPFGSLQHHLEGRARTLGFPGEPFGLLVTFWMGVERGFNGFKHKTTRYANNITCPVLLQWGFNDTYVTQPEIESVYKHLASSDKRLVVYQNAGHESFLRKDPLLWRYEVESFIQRSIK
ncbi:MAG: alpha/beta fold hydrolase [Chitinophagaceae bacterium]|nr:alpha/beta fold hydrolase [Chitinophagaceae bacterium]